jgi:hypothetical protein
MSNKIKIFLSYSHKDEEFKKQLDTQFAPLRQNGTVETWNDRKLLAGDYIDKEIDSKLLEANVIICLMSADFFDSKYILSNEFSVAMKRHEKKEALAIGVVVRACMWKETEIRKFLVLPPKDASPIANSENIDGTYVEIIEGILAAAKKFLSQEESQTANKKDSPKMPIGAENETIQSQKMPLDKEKETIHYTIPLPHEHIIDVKEEFFVEKMREFTDMLYKFTIDSQKIISDLNKNYLKSGKTSKEACNHLLVFFQSICRRVNHAFFYWKGEGVRTHFRYLHKSDEKYLKLAVAFGEVIDYTYALTPMPSENEGMIYHAARLKKPLIYSLNKEWHFPTGTTLANKSFKDYITFVLTNEDFKFHGEYLLSMGISFKNPECHQDLYYLMNLCRFDDVIVNIVKSYAMETKIDIVKTIVDNSDYIKELYLQMSEKKI